MPWCCRLRRLLEEWAADLRWCVRQAVPHTMRTGYTDALGRRHFVVWRMWLGRSYDVDDVILAAAWKCDRCGEWRGTP